MSSPEQNAGPPIDTMDAGGKVLLSAEAMSEPEGVAKNRNDINAIGPKDNPRDTGLGLQVNREFIQVRNVQLSKLRWTVHAPETSHRELVLKRGKLPFFNDAFQVQSVDSF